MKYQTLQHMIYAKQIFLYSYTGLIWLLEVAVSFHFSLFTFNDNHIPNAC